MEIGWKSRSQGSVFFSGEMIGEGGRTGEFVLHAFLGKGRMVSGVDEGVDEAGEEVAFF
jgi:hypothetical protein